MDPQVTPFLVFISLLVAIVVTLYEMGHSVRPDTCPECPHCRAATVERERRDEELSRTYAREHRILPDEDDDRRIG